MGEDEWQQAIITSTHSSLIGTTRKRFLKIFVVVVHRLTFSYPCLNLHKNDYDIRCTKGKRGLNSRSCQQFLVEEG